MTLGPANPIDLFNDSDFSEYSGDTGNISQETTTVKEGGSSVKYSTGSFSDDGAYSADGDGLPNYFSQGETFRGWVRIDDANVNGAGFIYGWEATNDWFRVFLQGESNDVEVYRKDANDSNNTVLDISITNGVNADTWYEIKLTWHDGSASGFSQGDHEVDILDTNGDSIDTDLPATGNDTHNANETGVGVHAWDGSSTNAFFDNWRVV